FGACISSRRAASVHRNSGTRSSRHCKAVSQHINLFFGRSGVFHRFCIHMTATPNLSMRSRQLSTRIISSLRDALTNHSHSKDFAYARSDYLRKRVMVVALLFLGLLPFWSMIDWWMLAPESRPYAIAGRIGMLATLLATYKLARHSRFQPQLARLSAG